MRFRRKLIILYAAFLIGMAVIWGRVLQLQTLQGEQWQAAALAKRHQTEQLQAPRGRIEDRTGSVLAEDLRVFQLAFSGWEWRRRARVSCNRCGVVHFHRVDKPPPKRCACERYAARRGAQLAAVDPETRFEPMPLGDLGPLEAALELPRGRLAALAAKRLAHVDALVKAEGERLRAVGVSDFRIDDGKRLKEEDLLRRPYVLLTGVSQAAVRMVHLDEQGRYRGFRIQTDLRRHYPHGDFAPQVLGYVSKLRDLAEYEALHDVRPDQITISSTIGRAGLERAFNWQLAGVRGERVMARDKDGLFTRLVSERPPRGGSTLTLSVDLETSRLAEERLEDHGPREGYHPGTRPSGAFVALDAVTGRLLVWSEMPRYDLNEDLGKVFSDTWNAAQVDREQERWVPLRTLPPGVDRAVWERDLVRPAPLVWSRVAGLAVEPGSTFKPLIALAALHSGRPLPFNAFRCGGLSMPGCHGCGTVGLERGITVSCNQFFAALMSLDRSASRTYWRTVPTFLEALGIGQPPSAELAEYKRGTWLRDWSDFSVAEAVTEALAQLKAENPRARIEPVFTRGRGFPRTVAGDRQLFISILRDVLLQAWRETGSRRIGVGMTLLEDLGSERRIRVDVRPLGRTSWAALPLHHSVARFDALPDTLKRAGRRVPAMGGKLRFNGSLARGGKVWFTALMDTRIGRSSDAEPRRIRKNDARNVGIGQGPVLATPLQMARAMAAIANGGRRVTPQLVWKLGGQVQPTAPAVDLAWDPAHVARVKAGMHDVVIDGTARNAGFEKLPRHVTVYAKTGTAQVGAAWRPFELPGEASSTWHHWFVGFAEVPGENPIAFACILHSREEAAAGLTSAKATADILDFWYRQRAAQLQATRGGR